MKVAVISLKQTPERWIAFLQRNQSALNNCEVLRIDGIDGNALLNSGIKTRLITTSAIHEWSEGAIGIGLTHRLCWRMCCNSGSPLVVLEDDVVLADNWQLQLEKLVHPDVGMILLGWNMDSMLRAQLNEQQEMISLFEPAYPSEKILHKIVNSDEARQSKRLRFTFGLPGYFIHPKTAKKLLILIQRLEALPLNMGRGFPDISTNGIDGLLNLHYHSIKAEIVLPPIALALNNPNTSLTRNIPMKFRSRDN